MRLSADRFTGPFAALVLSTVIGLLLASPAMARTQVVLGGTHSKDKVKDACDKAGGINLEGQGGKGYGCYNPNNGIMVACNSGGVCTGYIPRGKARGKSLDHVLATGLNATTVEGAPPSMLDSGDGAPARRTRVR